MSLDKVIAKGNDLVDRKLGGGVRIHHCGLIDGILFLCYGGLDGHKLNVDVGAFHLGADLGEITDNGRLDAAI